MKSSRTVLDIQVDLLSKCQASQGEQGVGGDRFYSRRYVVLPATVLLDLDILIVQVILQVVLLGCILSAEIRGCVRLFRQISTYRLLRHLILKY